MVKKVESKVRMKRFPVRFLATLTTPAFWNNKAVRSQGMVELPLGSYQLVVDLRLCLTLKLEKDGEKLTHASTQVT